jgi:long-chain acyl-CoA synthetase
MSPKFTLPYLFSESVRRNHNRNALGIVGEMTKSYGEVNSDKLALMAWFENLGIKPGDKVAILSTSMPNWGISYLAIVSMGAVVVPILPDFSKKEIENILKHSETKAIFVSERLANKIHLDNLPGIEYVISVENFTLIKGNSQNSYEHDRTPVEEYNIDEDDVASIIYTSGTTGKSKGVVLTHKNISFNAVKTLNIQSVKPGDRLLSILPLSHAYENTLGFILPMISGATVYYLSKAPTPSVLLPALKQVKPTLMLSVPLIIEKIYRNKILPKFQKNRITKILYGIPFIRKQLNRIAGKKLMDTFGGELIFFGIGGAKLDKRVEKFLREAKFPYAIGYGLTETSPLLAGCNADHTKLQSTGKKLDGIQVKINNPDIQTGEGEIWVKGPTVMKGYYKEPELTNEVFSEDGWFKTGDLGVFDKNNNLYIRGRLKNMILGETGENIYPEDIESVINNFKHVVESIVVQKKGKLVAMVHLNREEIEQRYHSLKGEFTNYIETRIEEIRNELHTYINSHVNRFSRIQHVMIRNQPFEKTPTQKIKRFLYK